MLVRNKFLGLLLTSLFFAGSTAAGIDKSANNFFGSNKSNYVWLSGLVLGSAGLSVPIRNVGIEVPMSEKLAFGLLFCACAYKFGANLYKEFSNSRGLAEVAKIRKHFAYYTENLGDNANKLYNFTSAGQAYVYLDKFTSYLRVLVDWRNSPGEMIELLQNNGFKLSTLVATANSEMRELDGYLDTLNAIYDCNKYVPAGKEFDINKINIDSYLISFAGKEMKTQLKKEVLKTYLVVLDHKRRLDIFKKLYLGQLGMKQEV